MSIEEGCYFCGQHHSAVFCEKREEYRRRLRASDEQEIEKLKIQVAQLKTDLEMTRQELEDRRVQTVASNTRADQMELERNEARRLRADDISFAHKANVRAERAEASAAMMRIAMDELSNHLLPDLHYDSPWNKALNQINAAMNPNVGKALLAEMRALREGWEAWEQSVVVHGYGGNDERIKVARAHIAALGVKP